MKKRYLSLLLAFVLCLSLAPMAAFAASGEVEAAAPVEAVDVVEEAAPAESAEPVMDGQPSETPAESAEPGETMQTQALDGEYVFFEPMAGVVIAGYGGKVVYCVSSTSMNRLDWVGTRPEGVTYSLKNSLLSITYNNPTEARTCKFRLYNGAGNETFDGQFSVLTLAAARAQTDPTIVTYEGFNLYKYTGTEASPTPLAGAVFGLYTSNPNDPAADAAPSPVATFTTDANGLAEIKLDGTTAENALPKLGDPTRSGAEKGGTNYFLKEITAPDGYVLSNTVWPVFGYAKWETDTNDATTSLKFVLEHPEDSGDGKWDESNPNDKKFTVSNQPLPNDYAGFDLVAWTKKDVTETGFDKELLDGVKFGVYSDAECTTLVKEFTTGSDGKVTIDPEQFADALPAIGETKTFYLKQTGAQDTAHGDRPMADECWPLTAIAVQEDAKVTTTLRPADERLLEDGTLWVYNERYVSLSFDLVKQVMKADKNAPLGENRFDFAIVPCTFGADDLPYPELVFTPEGGSPVVLSDHSMAEIKGNPERVYKVSLAVNGEGTAMATVTMRGWESAMRPLDVYETGDAPQDWKYADYMYMLQPTNTELAIRLCPESADGSYTGYTGRKYDLQSGEMRDGVVFTNTYTKAAPVPSPAPTAKPAQSPQTGDEANLALWLALATVSALGLGYVCMRKKEN